MLICMIVSCYMSVDVSAVEWCNRLQLWSNLNISSMCLVFILTKFHLI
jgi:hypothetical protein